ncbi:MAG: hypothetical protein ACFFCM_20880, partial [Promethearchaeota archaeon]
GNLYPFYKKRITFEQLVTAIKRGYDLSGIAIYFKVSITIIKYRIKAWFGETASFTKVRHKILKQVFLKYIKSGMSLEEIRKSFFRLDILDKNNLTIQRIKQLNLNNIKQVNYKKNRFGVDSGKCLVLLGLKCMISTI